MTSSNPRGALLEGKVASVLSERELVINIGSNHKVTPDMRFKVLAETPVEIHDPDSNILLGKVEREKVRVEAIRVEHTFTICRTFRKRFTGGGIGLGGLGDLFGPAREVYETLRADDEAYPPPLSESESYVKRGDRVVQIIND